VGISGVVEVEHLGDRDLDDPVGHQTGQRGQVS
jgi:hypothetical protein